jgi:trypsin-like peptidase
MSFRISVVGCIALELGGEAQVELRDAVLDGFGGFDPLWELILQLEQREADFSASSVKETATNLVRVARRDGWDGNLALAAQTLKPGNLAIQRFMSRWLSRPIVLTDSGASQRIGLGDQAGVDALQRSVTALNIQDMRTFLINYTRLSRQVCKVEVALRDSRQCGTGFLVGPDVVLTNYHVIGALLAEQGPASSVVCRFDYLQSPTKVVLDKTSVGLSTKARFPLAWAPPSQIDGIVDPTRDPADHELDYALLQLERAIGDEVVAVDGTRRGFVPIRDAPAPEQQRHFRRGDPLIIVQHPEGGPMCVAIDTGGVIGLNGNLTRLRYRTNTEAGSSGSPCFNDGMVAIALHHAGDPNFAPRHMPTFNQGIPLRRIVEHISATFAAAAALLGEAHAPSPAMEARLQAAVTPTAAPPTAAPLSDDEICELARAIRAQGPTVRRAVLSIGTRTIATDASRLGSAEALTAALRTLDFHLQMVEELVYSVRFYRLQMEEILAKVDPSISRSLARKTEQLVEERAQLRLAVQAFL